MGGATQGMPQMNMMGIGQPQAMPGMQGMNMMPPLGPIGPQGMGQFPNLLQASLPDIDKSINHNMLLQSQAGANSQFVGTAGAAPLAVGAGLTAFALNPYLLYAMAPYMLLGGMF